MRMKESREKVQEEYPYVICKVNQWFTVMGENQKNQYNGNQSSDVNKYIRLGADIDLSE